MELNELQLKVDQWIKTVGVRYFNELTNTVILNEEVGELSSLMARIYGEQSFKIPKTELEIKEALEDEMADVLWVLACLANQTGVDLSKAMDKNFNKKSIRDKNRHHNNSKLL